LNDALYELDRHRHKYPYDKRFFTVDGGLTFIAEYLSKISKETKTVISMKK